MAAQTILIIRHAEKPVQNGAVWRQRIRRGGPRIADPRRLAACRGMGRVFCTQFGPRQRTSDADCTFASNPDQHDDQATATMRGKSRRPMQTISPLAAKLDLDIDTASPNAKSEIGPALTAVDGAALVCWQHELIIDIVDAIAPLLPGVPDKWPGNRFNVIFRLDRPDELSAWKFQQIVPVLLGGDPSTPI